MLAERVQQRLLALGISANRASVEAGLGRDYVRDILRGKARDPSADRLRRLAFVLRCTPEYLTGQTDEVGTPRETSSPSAITLPILYQIRPGFQPNDDGGLAVPKDWPAQPLTTSPNREWLEYVRDPERGWDVPPGSLLHVSADILFIESVMQGPRLLVVTRREGNLIERSVRMFDLVGPHWALRTSANDDEPVPIDASAFSGRSASGVRVEGQVLAIYQFLGPELAALMRG